MNLAAVIQKMEYPHIRGESFIAWIYDKDQPRRPESVDPTARYACVDMLGPFETMKEAKRKTEAHIN